MCPYRNQSPSILSGIANLDFFSKLTKFSILELCDFCTSLIWNVFSKVKHLFKFNLHQRQLCKIGALLPWPEDRHSVSSSPLKPSLLRAFRKNKKIKSSPVCSFLLYSWRQLIQCLFTSGVTLPYIANYQLIPSQRQCRVFRIFLDDPKFMYISPI